MKEAEEEDVRDERKGEGKDERRKALHKEVAGSVVTAVAYECRSVT